MDLFTNPDICGNVFYRLLAIVGVFALVYWSVRWCFKAFLHVRFLKRCYWPSKRFEKRYLAFVDVLEQSRKYWSRMSPVLQQKTIDLLERDIDSLSRLAKGLSQVALYSYFGVVILQQSNTIELMRKIEYDYLNLRIRFRETQHRDAA